MDKPEFRVERGPTTHEAAANLMAKLLEREGRTVAADMLRRLQAQRDALLEALKEIVDAADGKGWEQLDPSFKKARAAIKAVEGEKK